MKKARSAFLAAAVACISIPALAQRVPNFGEKVCALWVAVVDRAKQDPAFRDQELMMEWWALGYLKGRATQYALSEKVPNPLLKLRPTEELEWMRAYCRVNPKNNISEAVMKLMEELESRP